MKAPIAKELNRNISNFTLFQRIQMPVEESPGDLEILLSARLADFWVPTCQQPRSFPPGLSVQNHESD